MELTRDKAVATGQQGYAAIGKKEWAYLAIKEKILDGTLAPLSDISEDSLMEELKVSRTPIREAFQRLEKEGFVYIYPRKGTIVTDITLDLIHHVYEVRYLNEPHMARQVCGRLPEDWLQSIRRRFQADAGGWDEAQKMKYFTDLDRELHQTILDYNDNPFLKSLIANVIDHTQRIRIKTSNEPANYMNSIGEHLQIIDSYLQKDADLAAQLTRQHIDTSKKNALSQFL